MTVYCDSDWANDIAGSKSCSGVLLLAGVPVTFWSKSQSNIALSSGEAELNSSVKAISETLGVINLWEELMKSQLHATVRVDSSACKGMLRSGSGRVKHLSTKQLWVQSVVEAFPLQIEKISRSDTCADMLTHPLAEAEVARHGFCLLKLIADLLVKSRGGTKAMQMLQRKCRQGSVRLLGEGGC